jgi:hypothetical protein
MRCWETTVAVHVMGISFIEKKGKGSAVPLVDRGLSIQTTAINRAPPSLQALRLVQWMADVDCSLRDYRRFLEVIKEAETEALSLEEELDGAEYPGTVARETESSE